MAASVFPVSDFVPLALALLCPGGRAGAGAGAGAEAGVEGTASSKRSADDAGVSTHLVARHMLGTLRTPVFGTASHELSLGWVERGLPATHSQMSMLQDS